MWEYKREYVVVNLNYGETIVDKMDEFGRDGWEIFNIIIVSEKDYDRGEYRLFMKKPIKTEHMSMGQGF